MAANYARLLVFISFSFSACFGNITTSTCIGLNRYAEKFTNLLFEKYGALNNGNALVLSSSHFEDLLTSVGLGKLRVECGEDSDCSHQHVKEHGELHSNNDYTADCLDPATILSFNSITGKINVTKEDFYRICPSLIQQLDSGKCVHYHESGHSQPNTYEKWVYGFISITVISLLCLSVIALVPCLKKSFYAVVMSYLVALAVGTLCGDALLHLIPHAFLEGSNRAGQVKISESEELKQHYAQVWRALFVLLGIYVFFVVEQFMKIKRPFSHDQKDLSNYKQNHSDARFMNDNENVLITEVIEDSESKSQDTHYDHYFHDDRNSHSHSHGQKPISKETNISSVAWMVIVGDGFHNLSDGLAVGAAFSASLSSGLSTAIAVFCHELPHELGDFAILIKHGMTVKQAIVYNLVSAFLAYVGLVVGILAGGNEIGRHFILSITAGLFLYVSLTDMLPELLHQDVPRHSRYATYICQHLGFLSGIGIMLIISLFEHSI